MRYVVTITGFRENRGEVTGIEKIRRDLRKHAAPAVEICDTLEWWEGMRDMALYLNRNSMTKPRLLVIAYSWGAGAGFLKLARACVDLGITIEAAVLCDAVYRSGLLPAWLPFNPLSITHLYRPTIKVPESVREVYWVRQDMGIPTGHDVVALNPAATRVHREWFLPYTHTQIDDSREFHDLCLETAERFLGLNTPNPEDLP